MADGITSAEGRLLAVQMVALRDDIREVKDTMRDVAKSLEQLVRLEENQKEMRSAVERAFDEIKINRGKVEVLEGRVAAIEKLRVGELRSWVIGGVISGNGMIASAIIYWFIQHHLN